MLVIIETVMHPVLTDTIRMYYLAFSLPLVLITFLPLMVQAWWLLAGGVQTSINDNSASSVPGFHQNIH